MNSKLKEIIESDIKRCRNIREPDEAKDELDLLISKYIAINKEMLVDLGLVNENGIVITDSYTSLKKLADRLELMIALDEEEVYKENNKITPDKTVGNSTSIHPVLQQIKDLITKTGEIKAEESVRSPMGYWHVSGPKYNNWINSVNILTQRHLVNHPLHDEILETCKRKNNPSTLKNIISYLETIAKDDEFWSMLTDQSKEDDEVETNGADTSHISKKVFIVHGHDNEAKLDVARTLEKAGFEAVILHEQHDNGLTIIQKIEKHTDVAFAVVLYTPCDVGKAKDDTDLKPRARQNVVFEHGYLMGKLGHNRVAALVKGDIEVLGDLNGIVYIKMDAAGHWRVELGLSMQDAGLDFDLNKIK